MKALLSRFTNRGQNKDKEPGTKPRVPGLPPLPQWPPSSLDIPPPTPPASLKPLALSHSSSSNTTEPTPTPTPDPQDTRPVTDSPEPTLTRPEPDSAGRSSRKTTGTISTATASDVTKKVAFISPPPSPAPALALDRVATTDSTTSPLKTNVSLFQARHVGPKDPRGSTSTAASSSRTELAKASGSTVKLVPSRGAPSPAPPSIAQSMRSTTPYSQMTYGSSRILAASSWSEGAEEDLVSNLGPRERTRQEVLWEIVASEERYVIELQKLKDTFIDPLLHPYSSTPAGSPGQVDYEDYVTSRVDSPRESMDHLPIASRFLSSPRPDTPQGHASSQRRDDMDAPNIDTGSLGSDEEDEGLDRMGRGFPATVGRQRGGASPVTSKLNHPRSPYGTAARTAAGRKNGIVPFPSRSHQSLPPPPRMDPRAASTQSLGRSLAEEQTSPNRKASGSTQGTSRVLRKHKKSNAGADLANGGIPPGQLPEDLRKCLEVIEGAIYNGHDVLSKGLRKRYEEQYPLVRSLADVFVSNSHILHGYATYVLHLERALEQIDDALSTASAQKKPKKQNADEWLKVCQFMQKLEWQASDKGETGLAISLSKPFQRLLKYPLLFQNLLFHTDPSTFEYESTLQMVAEVETIVRSIEDEKIQKEERDKTRDIFARIEGLEKVRQLALPKSSRLLVEERQVMAIGEPSSRATKHASLQAPSPQPMNGKVKGKSSFKRLSDVLQGNSANVGGKKDQWLVVFNDVVLRCQRTGTTSLPLTATVNSRTTSMPELQGKSKYASTGRRHLQVRPRNLYKFLKIETWSIGDVVQPRDGVIAMADVARTRVVTPTSVQPRIVPMPEDDDEDRAMDSDDSDRKSKMSFSYWGADKVTLQKPAAPKPKVVATRGRGGAHTTSYGRESSANAKFGTRLLANESPVPPAGRPASRRTGGSTPAPTTSRKVPISDDSHSARATVTSANKPAWVGSTRATATPVPKRPRNISQTSARATTTPKQLSSPAPSEDSGVGLYRQMMAKDSFLRDP